MKALRFLILFFFASLPNFSVRAQGGIFSRQLSHPAIFAITQDSSFFSHLTRDSVREQNKEWSQTEIAMPGGIISPTPPRVISCHKIPLSFAGRCSNQSKFWISDSFLRPERTPFLITTASRVASAAYRFHDQYFA